MLYKLEAEVSAHAADSIGDAMLAAGAVALDVAPARAADGLCRIRLYVEAGEVERLTATYRSLVARFSSEFSQRGEPTIDVDPVTNDWETKWSEGLVAVELIPGLVLVPEGASYEPSPGETAMLVEKGLVFGFGEHPTTQMASRWLASAVAGTTLLDIGTGTGVLALVAAHCGARSVHGVDIDAQSVRAARRNARRNGWQDLCHFSMTPLAQLEEKFEVVVANVDAATLTVLAPDVCERLVSPGGRLALTGVLMEQVGALQRVYAHLGVPLAVSDERQGWALLTCSA